MIGALDSADGPLTADDLSAAAPPRVSLPREWAYPSLRWGEEMGLVRTVGVDRESRMTLYEITHAGRVAISEAE